MRMRLEKYYHGDQITKAKMAKYVVHLLREQMQEENKNLIPK
jgi:hypothetical protein